MAHFGPALERLRLQAGFLTAYSFYHRNGGRRVFPFSFAHYRKLERGLSLPKAAWLPILVNSMRLVMLSDASRALTVAFLRDLVDDDSVFSESVAPLLRDGSLPPTGHKAVRNLYTASVFQLTVEQQRLIYSNAATFWVFYCVSNRMGPCTPAEVATAARLPAAAVRAAARDLMAAKLLRSAGRGSFTCPFVGAPTLSPYGYPDHLSDARRLLEFTVPRDPSLPSAFDMHGITRTSREGRLDMARVLSEAMEKCAAFTTIDAKQDADMVHVRTHITRVFPFR